MAKENINIEVTMNKKKVSARIKVQYGVGDRVTIIDPKAKGFNQDHQVVSIDEQGDIKLSNGFVAYANGYQIEMADELPIAEAQPKVKMSRGKKLIGALCIFLIIMLCIATVMNEDYVALFREVFIIIITICCYKIGFYDGKKSNG